MTRVRTSFTSFSPRAAAILLILQIVAIAAYYWFVFSRKDRVSPEVFNDAVYHPMPAYIGLVTGTLIWVFWGKQLVEFKIRFRAAIKRGPLGFLGKEITSSSREIESENKDK